MKWNQPQAPQTWQIGLTDGQVITRSKLDYPGASSDVEPVSRRGALVVESVFNRTDRYEVFAPGSWVWAKRVG